MKVIIGGAGITGLAVGAYLEKKTIDYKIFERSDSSSNSITAIQLASNCHFVLQELNLLDGIKNLSIQRSVLNVYSEDRYLTKISVTNSSKEGTLFIRRKDLLSTIASLIPRDKIYYSSTIENISSNEHNVDVSINNKQLTSDLFIGSLGQPSSVVSDFTKTNTIACWGISDISEGIFQEFNNFLFSGLHLVTYPLTNDQTAFTLVFDSIKHPVPINEITLEVLNLITKNKFESLFNCSGSLITKHIYTSKANTWGSERILNIGDAAHALTPHLAQGAAQGLIDAAFLNLNINNENIHDCFYKRNQLLNKLRSEANANKFRYQLGQPFKLLRNIYLKLHNPNYSWLFDSKYELKH